MVNTRILEQRLGWRAAGDGEEPLPPARPIAHAPMLQGRIEPSRHTAHVPGVAARGHRRASVDDAWERLPEVRADLATLKPRGHAPSFARGSAAGVAMDQLRTQLMRVIDEKGWHRIGVTSPARGAGRSFVAAGLAASIARLETARVLLIDTDFEEPGLATLLGIAAPGPIEAVLSGTRHPEEQLLRVGSTLALALNAAPVAQAPERMLTPDAILALRAMIDLLAPDVVILDMPPVLDDPLAPALLPQLDAVLLVTDGLRNTAQDVLEAERVLEGQVPILGLVLNKSEDRDPRCAARQRR